MAIDPARLLAFLSFAEVMSAVPGPSVILAARHAIVHDWRSAMGIVCGNSLGGLLLVLLVPLGLGALVSRSAIAFTLVKTAGALYLAWLGLRALMSARSASLTPPQQR